MKMASACAYARRARASSRLVAPTYASRARSVGTRTGVATSSASTARTRRGRRRRSDRSSTRPACAISVTIRRRRSTPPSWVRSPATVGRPTRCPPWTRGSICGTILRTSTSTILTPTPRGSSGMPGRSNTTAISAKRRGSTLAAAAQTARPSVPTSSSFHCSPATIGRPTSRVSCALAPYLRRALAVRARATRSAGTHKLAPTAVLAPPPSLR